VMGFRLQIYSFQHTEDGNRSAGDDEMIRREEEG
jgi:hypothetical protein